MNLVLYIYKIVRRIVTHIQNLFGVILTEIKFLGNGVVVGFDWKSIGHPSISVSVGGRMQIGTHFKMNNRNNGNPLSFHPCSFWVGSSASLNIGNNVGISQTAIITHSQITIGNNVKIGSGCLVVDTDFHSLNPKLRMDDKKDRENVKSVPVKICDNVFVGARSIVLKGVVIGENSIIGAGSVVTRSIPPNEIWAGNPAKFIRKF